MAAENVLLLPGMMCDARMWADQIEAIESPVSIPDLSVHDNFADMAASVLGNAPDRFAVAGLSMGGILAFELWRQAPDRITHMALLDTNPFSDSPDRQSLRLQQIEQVLAGGLRELAVDSLKPLYLAESNRDDEALLNVMLDMAMELGPDTFRRQSLALRNRQDSVETLPLIDCPVTVICGSEDTLCPLSHHEYMANRIPNAELIVIDDCGHLSSMEQADIVSTELLRLFARNAQTGNLHANQQGQNSYDSRR
jgi:pimeloyl-ACP methyl ester carboxylesterase